jgi:hypothetical protein
MVTAMADPRPIPELTYVFSFILDILKYLMNECNKKDYLRS